MPSRTGSSASLGGASSLAEIATSQGSTVADDRFDLKRLLNNSNFVLPLSATGAGTTDGTQLTLWGAGDYRDLKGADGVRWSGDLFIRTWAGQQGAWTSGQPSATARANWRSVQTGRRQISPQAT